MLKFIVTLMLTSSFSGAFAREVRPNQQCMGMNSYDEKVETKLFVGKKIDRKHSQARLVINYKSSETIVIGKITNKADLLGTRMLLTDEDNFRYLTSGLLYDFDKTEFQLNMDCTQFRK